MADASTNWMMLERFVFRRDDAHPFPDEEEAEPFRIGGRASLGPSFVLAFRFTRPPQISRLFLQWQGGPKSNPGCYLMAAHRDLLLLALAPDPVTLHEPPYVVFEQLLFILRPQYDKCKVPLVLHQIPMCTIPVLLHVKKNGTEITMPRRFDPQTVGILCRGEEDFAVAHLALYKPHSPSKMEAELCVLRSSIKNHDHNWEVETELCVLYEADEIFDLDAWSTHKVVPFNNCICWVNYAVGGVLLCEVFQKKPNISYLRLPIHNRCLRQRPILDRNCSVCITKGVTGIHELIFVDVVRKDGRLTGPLSPRTGFSIAYHVLRTTESGGMQWSMTFFLTSAELWDLNECLPHEALMFPHVSMEDPNVVCFLLEEIKEHHRIDKVSLVTIDMSKRKVLSLATYIEEKDLRGKDPDLVEQRSNYLQSFLLSELPKFMNHKCKCGFFHAAITPTAASTHTAVSRQVNINTAVVPDGPAFNTRSRKKIAM